jgi:hypothetical protein
VLLVSGGPTTELELGDAVTDVLAKPFSLAEIATRLQALLATRR